MTRFVNRGERTFGEYGEPGYHATFAEQAYEERRFGSSRAGRRKHRHELALVERFVAHLPPAQTVLDVPCGMGRFTGTLLTAGHRPISVDLNVGMLQRAQARWRDVGALVQGDVFALPLGDRAVDAAICFRLLHHLPDNLVLAALAELRRVARAVALVTYYDTRSLKYLGKTLRGRRTSGQYYSASHMRALCGDAGWPIVDHLNPFDVRHNLHALRLVA